MNYDQISLHTDRLKLVPINPDFLQDVFDGYRGSVVTYMNYDPAERIEDLAELIDQWQDNMKAGTMFFAAVVNKANEEFLGCMMINGIGKDIPEMGGWLKPTAHGSGFGREAAEAIRSWADEHLEFHHIVWPCAIENTASCKLAESLGGEIGRVHEYTSFRNTTYMFRDYWFRKTRPETTSSSKPQNHGHADS